MTTEIASKTSTGRFLSSMKLSIRSKRSQHRIDPAVPITSRPSENFNQSPNVDHDNNNVTASKASVIRILCNSISQGLYGASLNDDLLQEVSVEIAKYSLDAIKRKKLAKNSNEDLLSTGGRSLQKAINERMANVVENEVKSPAQLRPIEEVEPLPMKTAFDLFTKLPDDDGQYDVFLNICDADLRTNQQQLMRDYVASKRSDINIPYILFTLAVGTFFVSTGLPWSSLDYYHYPTAALFLLLSVLTGISVLWVALNRIAFLSFRYNIVYLQWYHKYVMKLYDSSYGQWPDNIAIVCSALATGVYLVNIVLMDLCNPDMVVNIGQSNNYRCGSPVEPPPEAFVFSLIIILMGQIAMRGASHTALLCSWIICFVFINVTIYLSSSANYVWMNLLQSLIMGISYELERQPLRMYLKTLKAIEASEVAAKLKVRLAAYETLQAAEALKAKCSLVRHIGHEIRTPLNVVGVGVDMLMKELEPHAAVLPDNVMEIINDIKEASSASLEVVNELLMFEKLAAGMTTLECVPTPVLPFLEQAMRQHMMPARAKNISFELVRSSYVTRNVAIDVDPVKLITVFRNLFSNAIKFTKKEGRVTVRVEIKKLDGIEMVEVTVQDSGAGLSPTNLGKLFGEGVQFNANGLQGGGGSGLGLFITKGIVDLHKNGKIWAESEGEGKGCTFFVQLPLHSHHYLALTTGAITDMTLIPSTEHIPTRPNEQPDEKQAEAHEGHRPLISRQIVTIQPLFEAVDTWKPTILVVDDSAMNRKMLVRMLISKGFACREAEDGVEALSEMSRMYMHKCFGGSDMNQSPSRLLPLSRRSSLRFSQKRLSSSHMHQEEHEQQEHFAIDAVLIDSNMPRMNGPEAIVEMRKIGFRGPIIGVSGGDEKTMKLFLQAGADNVMQKPAQSDKLVELLLTGLDLVVQEAISRILEQSLMNGNNVHATENAWQEHINRLGKFIEKTDAAAKK